MPEKKKIKVKKNTSVTTSNTINVENAEGMDFLQNVADKSVDLILTDPPYIISKESGMEKHYNMVSKSISDGVEFVKTEEEWLEYKKTLKKPSDELEKDYGKGWSKENYLKYGCILGKKYCKKVIFAHILKN